ncbi:hypothetical protein PV327_010943 [Microctonus hyperodae]|uniref:Transposase domain-containing protein n=1 Tax=Microctonus hyperodae TaxID=165561 RepID=A0AA39KUP8_MICHY|nr:hypothetical protein PV327_010943 [Microctonus hyperodae]
MKVDVEQLLQEKKNSQASTSAQNTSKNDWRNDVNNEQVVTDYEDHSVENLTLENDGQINSENKNHADTFSRIEFLDNLLEPATTSNPPEINQLRQWAIKSNISHTHLSELLIILNKRLLPELPNTAKTFLKTSLASYKIHEMEDALHDAESGQFVYFGIAQGLQECLVTFHKGDIELIINIDGLPISKSGKKHFWPILCKIFHDPDVYEPFTVAIYCGPSKPRNVDDYFAYFIDELNQLQREGIIIIGKKFYVRLKAIVADTPARSMCKGTKGHGGYSACERCTVYGTRIKKSIERSIASNQKTIYSTKIVYPGIGHPKRTNMSFRNRSDPEHHTGLSPLEEIVPELDMITIFVLDFMHLICVGAMKKILELLTSGPLKIRLSSRNRRELSRRMISLKSQTIKEFQRKPQPIDCLAKWKATQFRFFVLYCGPIVLKKLLPAKLYKHFLLLHASMRILYSERLVMFYKDKARKYLEIFVSALPYLYSEDAQVINMHNLQHIVDDVENLNCDLSKVNCFPFENYLRKIKNSIRTPNQPLEQYCRRKYERSLLPKKVISAPMPFEIIRSSVINEEEVVKSLKFNSSFIITTTTPNNVVLLQDGSVMEITKIFSKNTFEQLLHIKGKIWKKKLIFIVIHSNRAKSTHGKFPNKFQNKQFIL